MFLLAGGAVLLPWAVQAVIGGRSGVWVGRSVAITSAVAGLAAFLYGAQVCGDIEVTAWEGDYPALRECGPAGAIFGMLAGLTIVFGLLMLGSTTLLRAWMSHVEVRRMIRDMDRERSLRRNA